MITKKQRVSPSVSQQKMSGLSKLFRFLINISAFPLKVDQQKNQLKFAFCSAPAFIFSIYLIGFSAVGQIGTAFLGYDKIMKWFSILASQSETTDAISGVGSMMMGWILASCIFIFVKARGVLCRYIYSYPSTRRQCEGLQIWCTPFPQMRY